MLNTKLKYQNIYHKIDDLFIKLKETGIDTAIKNRFSDYKGRQLTAEYPETQIYEIHQNLEEYIQILTEPKDKNLEKIIKFKTDLETQLQNTGLFLTEKNPTEIEYNQLWQNYLGKDFVGSEQDKINFINFFKQNPDGMYRRIEDYYLISDEFQRKWQSLHPEYQQIIPKKPERLLKTVTKQNTLRSKTEHRAKQNRTI